MPIDPNDPVVVAQRKGGLTSFLREALAPLVGEPLTHLGHTLDMIEVGFGEEVSAPTSRHPARMLSQHIFHCQCTVEVNGQAIRPDTVDAFTSVLRRRPVLCEDVDADEFGNLYLALSGGQVLMIRTDSDHEIEHWRYFRPHDPANHLVFLEEA